MIREWGLGTKVLEQMCGAEGGEYLVVRLPNDRMPVHQNDIVKLQHGDERTKNTGIVANIGRGERPLVLIAINYTDAEVPPIGGEVSICSVDTRGWPEATLMDYARLSPFTHGQLDG